MARSLSLAVEHYPIAGHFAISRGSRTVASVIVCTIVEDGIAGRGECVPYARYGESIEQVRDAILSASAAIAGGIGREELRGLMPAGAARNAIDCALWDLELKSGRASAGDATGGLGSEIEQRADGGSGALARLQFQHLTHEHQRYDDR